MAKTRKVILMGTFMLSIFLVAIGTAVYILGFVGNALDHEYNFGIDSGSNTHYLMFGGLCILCGVLLPLAYAFMKIVKTILADRVRAPQRD